MPASIEIKSIRRRGRKGGRGNYSGARKKKWKLPAWRKTCSGWDEVAMNIKEDSEWRKRNTVQKNPQGEGERDKKN